MSIFKEFFTPKQEREPGPPLSVVLHPFYPQSLLLPGYEPLTIPFDQILGIFFGSLPSSSSLYGLHQVRRYHSMPIYCLTASPWRLQ